MPVIVVLLIAMLALAAPAWAGETTLDPSYEVVKEENVAVP